MPAWKITEAQELAASQGTAFYEKFPLHPGVQFVDQDNIQELYLNHTWRPNLAITGASGLPPLNKAGNVIRPSTEVRLSMRLSPLTNCEVAID